MFPEKNFSLKEQSTHGDFLLPLMKYHCHLPKDFTIIPLHWHEQMEFTLIREGVGLYHINLMPYEVKAGDILLIPPFTLHSTQQKASLSMISDTFVFNLEMLNLKTPDACSIKYISPIYETQYTFPCIISPGHTSYDTLYHLFNLLNSHYDAQLEGFELRIKAVLFELIATLFEQNLINRVHTSSPHTLNTQRLKTILDYINQNLCAPLTIHDVAQHCGLSGSYFMSFFKKHTGMTYTHYINTLRLDLAAKFLRTKNLPIMDIALEVGFDNLSYFNRCFKSKYNLTPRQYRQTCEGLYS